MQLDPKTKLRNLLDAIPSASAVCQHFHIPISGNEQKSLEQLCTESGITLGSFLQVLDSLDWEEESRFDSR